MRECGDEVWWWRKKKKRKLQKKRIHTKKYVLTEKKKNYKKKNTKKSECRPGAVLFVCQSRLAVDFLGMDGVSRRANTDVPYDRTLDHSPIQSRSLDFPLVNSSRFSILLWTEQEAKDYDGSWRARIRPIKVRDVASSRHERRGQSLHLLWSVFRISDVYLHCLKISTTAFIYDPNLVDACGSHVYASTTHWPVHHNTS